VHSKHRHCTEVATYHRDAYAIDSVKYWVREDDGGRRDRTDFPKAGRLPSDIAEAVSQVLNQQPFSSTKYIATQLRASSKLVKKTLNDAHLMIRILEAIAYASFISEFWPKALFHSGTNTQFQFHPQMNIRITTFSLRFQDLELLTIRF
jgi:hypothetical protein